MAVAVSGHTERTQRFEEELCRGSVDAVARFVVEGRRFENEAESAFVHVDDLQQPITGLETGTAQLISVSESGFVVS